MKKKSVAWLGLAAVGLWSAVAYGQAHLGRGLMLMGPGGFAWEGPGMALPLILKGAHLTPDQQSRVHAIMEANRPTFRALFSQIHAAQAEMADKLFAPGDVDAEDLTPQVQHIAQLREQLMQEGLKVALQVRAILTPEQLARVAQLKNRLQALRQEMRDLFEEKP